MIQLTSTPAQKKQRDYVNKKLLQYDIERLIRSKFDKATLSLEAESWITIAKEMGFIETAEQMEADLQHELETA